MNFLNFDFRRIFIMAALVAMPLASIQMQQRSGKEPWIFQPFLMASSSTQYLYSSFGQGVRDTVDLYLNLIDTKKKYREINEKLNATQIALSELQELKLENERLAKLLKFKQQVPMDLLPVRIIGRDVFSEYQSIVIDRGSHQGVKKGMAVLNAEGAIGYVLHAGPEYSFILLLTDRYAVLDVIIQRSRARGILGGQGLDEYELKYLKRNDDILKGDQIITSGLDNIFPKGVIVGTVNSIEKSEYGFEQIVQITPAIKADNLEEAYVVLNPKNFDYESLDPIGTKTTSE